MTDHTLRKNIMQKSKLYVKLEYAIWKNDKGQDHRVDGPAVEHSDGTKSWYLNGERHREDGPAWENVYGTAYWLLNGERHREDGPAIVYSNGDKVWYLNGMTYTEEDYNDKIKTLR